MNRIRTLPSFLFNDLSALKNVTLPRNEIRRIEPHVFAGCSDSLTRLDLSDNHVEFLKVEHFKSLRSFNYLDMSRNSISSIQPGAFDDLVVLEELRLKDNCLFKIDRNLFLRLENLEMVDLSANSISKLSLKSQTRLKSLNLSMNLIERFSHQANEIAESLTSIDLSSNVLLRTFQARQSLQHLNLNGNKVLDFVGNYSLLYNLRYLFGGGLKRAALARLDFRNFNSLEKLDLSFGNLTNLNIFFLVSKVKS
jgi:Leucine-rich repeat (LRR) protein